MILQWMKIYLILVTLLSLTFSLLAYFYPAFQFGSWSAFGVAGATSLIGPVGLYIARNLATVAVGAFALGNGSLGAITAAYILRAVTDAVDGAHNLVGGNVSGAVFALVLFAVEVFALSKLVSFKQQA